MPRTDAAVSSRHILTVALEDYFHVAPFQSRIAEQQWYRFEMRLEQSVRATLALLDEHGVRATFFVLGWVADTVPELVREVADRGHEVASKGYHHRDLAQLDRAAFADDVLRAREALERAIGRRVLGYRVPQGWFGERDLWALEVLARAGYVYDSSVRLLFREFAAEPWRRFVHWTAADGRAFLEVPISSVRIGGLSVPIAGGNYIRQFPHALVRRAVDRWSRRYHAPLVMYFHTWELDPQQPRLNTSTLQRVRQYRNLERMPATLRHYLATYRFTSVADYFELRATAVAPTTELRRAPPTGAPSVSAPAAPTAVTVVIPCYNEGKSVRYLANTLGSLVRQHGERYAFEFLFVDDGSVDDTWPALQEAFGHDSRCQFLRHQVNRGIAAAIQTGIGGARTEIVCSIDCDCTYDPHELGRMIERLEPGIDLVVASPYHPEGRVKNVPEWRLVLSRGLSRLYRLVLPQRLHTYTSCFRVYRRAAVEQVELVRHDFLGVAELVGRVALAGGQIAEHPTTLEARMIGRSKMKVLRTIVGHLGLLARLGAARLRGRRHTLPTAVP